MKIVVVARNAFDVEGGLLRLQEGDGLAVVRHVGGGGRHADLAGQARIAAGVGQRVGKLVAAVELGGGVGEAAVQRIGFVEQGGLHLRGGGVRIGQHRIDRYAEAGCQVLLFDRVVGVVGFDQARHFGRQRTHYHGCALLAHLVQRDAQHFARGHVGAGRGVLGVGTDVGDQRRGARQREAELALGIGDCTGLAAVAAAVVVGIDADRGALVVAGQDDRVGRTAGLEGAGGEHAAHGDVAGASRRSDDRQEPGATITAAACGEKGGGQDRQGGAQAGSDFLNGFHVYFQTWRGKTAARFLEAKPHRKGKRI